jgi:sigma-E factor negative regulatory protein RseB
VSIVAHPGRRLTGAGLVIVLAGAALAALTIVETATGPAASPPAGPLRPARLAAGTSAAARSGLRLLSAAATAGLAVPYGGQQMVSWSGPQGMSTSVLQVWHPRDGAIRADVQQLGSAPVTSDGSPASAAAAALTASQEDPDGALGFTATMVALAQVHYAIAAAGPGWAAGRRAQVVELSRADGSLAARFWLDQATKLPLRRQVYDGSGKLISEDEFINLRIGDGALSGMPPPSEQAWSSWLSPAQLRRLRAAGWPAPATMPGGLRLIAAHRSARVLDLDYSDGLSVISVFLQPGELPGQLPGWQHVELGGHQVYSSDPDHRSLSWSARGYVYTVIGEAPTATVSAVVAALPADHEHGFWTRVTHGLHRMAHGMKRLASWANPFR